MDQTLLNSAPKLAMKNRDAVHLAVQCGCYYCCQVFPSVNVTEWTDNSQTALCPHCLVDAVVPGPVTEADLKLIHDHWFAARKSDHDSLLQRP